jgi:endogenous inhibitor of DNA gyrase (YacG/DUF329 family)
MGRAKAAAPAAAAAPLDPSPLLTPEEAARFLGVSGRTLANWRTREIGPPFVRISQRCIMYRSVDLQRWAQGIVNVPTGVDDTRRAQRREQARAETADKGQAHASRKRNLDADDATKSHGAILSSEAPEDSQE